MPHIVSPVTFLESLGETDVTPAILNALDLAESLFEAATHRTFAAAQSSRTEVHDGNGQEVLYLDYPVAVLTSVKLGYNPAAPAETLVVDDQAVLNWKVGSARLQRVGGKFGRGGEPNYVQVVYNAQGDISELAEQAILLAGRLAFTGGLEGVSAERIGAYSVEFQSSGNTGSSALENSQVWTAAVNAHMRVVVA